VKHVELSNELRRIESQPGLLEPVLEFLVDQASAETRSDLLSRCLPRLAGLLGSRLLALTAAERGNWVALDSVPQAPVTDLPHALLSEVLDREQLQNQGLWLAAPLLTRAQSGQLLAARFESPPPAATQSRFDALAAALGIALQQFELRQRQQRRVRRLEAILEIAGQWSQNLETESLLTQMAETSTRLLGAERASIFLWDRSRRLLIGRPALGVEDGELRIPDDAGVVGHVVQSGEPRRVDAQSRHDGINRQVDQQLGYETRTLLCVPLRGRKGQILGAFEMINKTQGNFTAEDEAGLMELASHAATALENSQQYEQLLSSRKQMVQQAAEGVQLIGETPVIRELRSTIQRVAPTDLALLVLGENGTGKEVVSRMVHYLSPRRNEPFVPVNCAAITETLLESELFGHEKGAFTDAHEARAGKFEAASGGTLFLDEIGDLSPSGQAKLLRVLEDKVVVRVGGNVPIPTDTRVIAATNQDLMQMVRQRRFREDLFFRLHVVALKMPPLRERVDDIPVLAEHFLRDFAARAHRRTPALSQDAIRRLRQHHWPGNVRELRNLMERLAYLQSGDTVEAADLDFILMPGRGDSLSNISLELTLADATKSFQTEFIRRHIDAASGNMSDAARHLGLHRSNLYRKMRQLQMPLLDEESESDRLP
jgi:Nif-specific regulatory protein